LIEWRADAEYKNNVGKILHDICNTPVSPELLPAKDGEIVQKTEEVVGPYLLHDFFLYYMLRLNYSPSKNFFLAKQAFAGEIESSEIKKWMLVFYKRFFSQQFKRSAMPDGPKVGSVALSPRGDLRMPSDASANLWLVEIEGLL
jgi:NAD+ synthase (glutamine-hydrolysing)